LKIPYRDLSVRDPALRKALLGAVEDVLSHGRLILGPEVEIFEGAVAKYCEKRFAVGVGSGTQAIYLALKSFNVGPGDEVITTPLSWIATLNAITECGATPVFVDIAEDLNIDATLIPKAITSRTKVILPVHFTGKVCDMVPIMKVASEHNIHVVEDAAQAFGARYLQKPAGAFGKASCFSMNPMKVFNGYGESGAILTDDQEVRDRLTILRYAGTVNRHDCIYPALNGRMDTIQAAMLLVSLDTLEAKIQRRREIASNYSSALKDVVICPTEASGSRDIYYAYTIITERREDLITHMAESGIETQIQHPILMPNHTAYHHLPKPHLPVAEHMVNRILSIPNHENLSDPEIKYVADSIKEFHRRS